MQKQIPSSKKAIISWCFYDWAVSSFNTIITTFVFAAYFTKAVAVNKIIGTAQWGHTIAIAGILIAIISPMLGAIADHEGRRKPWLISFTILAIIASALLWFAMPNVQHTYWLLGCVLVGTIGMEIAVVFYNSMLHDIAPKGYLGRISGWAWGLGYAGGLLALTVALFVFVEDKTAWFHFDHNTAEQIRACGPLVAVWIGVFSLPLFFFTPDTPKKNIPLTQAIRQGLSSLSGTLKKALHYKQVFKFLIARMLYIDGLNTLFAFGGIYAAGTFDMSFTEIIAFGITLNIAAGLGAASFAWFDDWFGAKPTIMISLIAMIILGTSILIIHDKQSFWILTTILCVFVGPVQAASRSLFIRIAPREILTEMFGLYAFSGKATAFLGPWLVATVTYQFASQRAGMSTIIFFLITGAILLLMVKVPLHRK